ncbi:RecQ mediated genome instability protein Rmi1 [Podospora fimiseda]|uniref:RecQ mediated genome instability protein Rmi1 n=1 Tax=Podospora fimiseda TaxID=252190 RepID=A0AAN7BYH3_9PEZI|nr:RecQ mediated genome instability protein Rmi1 [Podospora fimiseda]
MPPSTPSLPTLLHSSLSSTPSIPLPSLPFLTQLCASRVPPPPLASLLATARARILAADLTTPQLLDPTYISSHSFPSNLYNPQTESLSLSIDTIVQVLDIENLSKSRWEQIEELEAAARGETKRGREIIRITEDENNNNNNDNAIDRGQTQATQAQTQAAQQQQQQQQQNTKATHKLLLQDVKGQKVYGLELHKVDSIGVDTISIGGKVLLKRGTKVCRGVVMLEPGFTVVLGGKVGVWDKSWREGRLERLKRSAEGGGEN